MTNLTFILKLLKNGKENTHIKILDMLINCIANYDKIEFWAMNYRWLFEEVPKEVEFLIEGGNQHVQFPENPDLDISGHDAIMPESRPD